MAKKKETRKANVGETAQTHFVMMPAPDVVEGPFINPAREYKGRSLREAGHPWGVKRFLWHQPLLSSFDQAKVEC
jgi:hypothetical protein